MKKNTSTILLILIFLLGLCILLYPLVANWVNSRSQKVAITDYESVLHNIEKKDYTPYFEAADRFNHRVRDMENPIYYPEDLRKEYMQVLNVPGSEIMGYIDIDKLELELPIYHTTDAVSLSSGVGHMEGTSVPVGGKGTHAVLSAHRGLPSAKLFSDLDEMQVGDLFTITVLDRLMTYQVDQVKIVLPKELEDISIDPEEDYVTLVTCTPYGINTHRILVRGTRVDNVKIRPQVYVPNEAIKVDPLVVTPIVAVPLLIIMMITVAIKYRKR